MTTRKKKSPSELLRSAAAYEQIKIDIVACLLKPGEQITEGELQERYDIGKATLRAALARLSQYGLIRSEPRRGYRITPLTLRDVNEIFDTRLVVEPTAMKLGAFAMADHSLEISPAGNTPDAETGNLAQCDGVPRREQGTAPGDRAHGGEFPAGEGPRAAPRRIPKECCTWATSTLT